VAGAFGVRALRVARLSFGVWRSSFIVHCLAFIVDRSSFGVALFFSFSYTSVLYLLFFTPWGLPHILGWVMFFRFNRPSPAIFSLSARLWFCFFYFSPLGGCLTFCLIKK